MGKLRDLTALGRWMIALGTRVAAIQLHSLIVQEQLLLKFLKTGWNVSGKIGSEYASCDRQGLVKYLAEWREAREQNGNSATDLYQLSFELTVSYKVWKRKAALESLCCLRVNKRKGLHFAQEHKYCIVEYWKKNCGPMNHVSSRIKQIE